MCTYLDGIVLGTEISQGEKNGGLKNGGRQGDTASGMNQSSVNREKAYSGYQTYHRNLELTYMSSS
jgi:hypothetical protein